MTCSMLNGVIRVKNATAKCAANPADSAHFKSPLKTKFLRLLELMTHSTIQYNTGWPIKTS